MPRAAARRSAGAAGDRREDVRRTVLLAAPRMLRDLINGVADSPAADLEALDAACMAEANGQSTWPALIPIETGHVPDCATGGAAVALTGISACKLSEGERRGVALAAFLAELATREDRSGVVFDDPVSSLDHDRRCLVAKRLTKLASERQVVVFTHDLVFLHMLKTAAAEEGGAITDREVRKTATTCGLCRDKPPAKALRAKALVGELKERQQTCAAAHRAGRVDSYELQLAHTFGLLREGWERADEAAVD